MELTGLVVVGAAILGLVTLARTLVEGPTNKDRLVAVLCLVIAVVAVVLVGASDFAEQEIVLDRPLNSLNGASQALLGILLAGTASAAWTGLKALSLVGSARALGDRQPPAPPA